MSNAITRLQRIINAGREPIQGQVIRAFSDTVQVRTARGVVSALRRPGDITQYRDGDLVTISNGFVSGRRVQSKTYPI